MNEVRCYAIDARSEEEGAVITARTSRSSKTFAEIAEEVRERGHVEFLEENVLGYGHDSVAEMAQCPWIAVEGLSDLAASVLSTADPQLRVQMTSTRFQKMEARNVVHASGEAGDRLVANMMARLRRYQEVCVEVANASDHPRKLTLARDISRGWMPAGIRSQLAVRHDARGMRDTICYLLGHPYSEVASVGEGILEATRQYVEVLLERHIVPAPVDDCTTGVFYPEGSGLQPGQAVFREGLKAADQNLRLHRELRAWRDSGYRRRHRVNACPEGPYLVVDCCTDWGAYRDLRRNRTIHQLDLFPSPLAWPEDPLWAFREGYPDVCENLAKKVELGYVRHELDDPYLALMGSVVRWPMGGHALNWAYAMRVRSKLPGCHPAYALPIRALMLQIVYYAPTLASVMGLVQAPKALGGVEFADRV